MIQACRHTSTPGASTSRSRSPALAPPKIVPIIAINEKSESDVSSAEEDGVISITPPSPPTQGAGTTLQPPDRRLVHLAHLAHLEPDFRGSTTVHQAVHFYPNLWRNGAAAEPLGHWAAGR